MTARDLAKPVALLCLVSAIVGVPTAVCAQAPDAGTERVAGADAGAGDTEDAPQPDGGVPGSGEAGEGDAASPEDPSGSGEEERDAQDVQQDGEAPEGDVADAAEGEVAAPKEGDPTDAEATEEQRARAREAYGRGQQFFEQGEYDKAAQAFAQAYALVPDPVVLLGIAKARREAGAIVDAIEALELYLEKRPDAPDKKEVQGRLTKLRTTPAVLQVTTKPSGAHIRVDGERSDKTTPAEITVSPGEHTVELELEGHRTASKSVRLPPGGRKQIEVELEKAQVAEAPEEQPFGQKQGITEPKAEKQPKKDKGEREITTDVWISAGVAASGLVTGTVLGFLALSEESDFERMPTDGTADSGERFALFADVAFGIAGAAAITSLVLFLTGEKNDEEDEASESGAEKAARAGMELRIHPMAGPEGGGVSAEVSF